MFVSSALPSASYPRSLRFVPTPDMTDSAGETAPARSGRSEAWRVDGARKLGRTEARREGARSDVEVERLRASRSGRVPGMRLATLAVSGSRRPRASS